MRDKINRKSVRYIKVSLEISSLQSQESFEFEFDSNQIGLNDSNIAKGNRNSEH